MFKTITIGGKDYKLEYGIEATLNRDCISKLMDMFGQLGIADENMSSKERVSSVISVMSDISNVALNAFYAGLMKYHGTGRYGDRTVTSLVDAMYLIDDYFKENPDSEDSNFYAILNLCAEQMEEDGFFQKTGLSQMMNQGESNAPMNRQQRRATSKKATNK